MVIPVAGSDTTRLNLIDGTKLGDQVVPCRQAS